MENTFNFNPDILSDINISLSSTLLAMIFSVISALVIRSLYINFGRSLNNREYFGNTFLILAVTTCSVIIIVKYSLALSLGLVGALSIVRFRAAIKEPEELVYLFLVIACGLAFGANQFMIGFVLLTVSAIAIIMSRKFVDNANSYDHTGTLMIFSGPRDAIINFRKNVLPEIIQSNNFTFLKEIEYEGSQGKIILKASTNEQLNNTIDYLESFLITQDKIEFNFISDVSIPA